MNTRPLIIAAFILFALAPTALALTSGVDTSGNTVSGIDTSGTNVTLINPLGVGSCNSANGGCLMTFLNQILKFVIQIGAVVVVLMLVYVGFLFVVAQGNETKITEARRALLYTIIGALILLGAQAISIGICETANALSTGGSVTSCIF